MKTTVETTVKSTIIAVFAINSLTGSSGEMMFSFVNNLQIIYMFPLWNLSIPNHYGAFLDSLEASDFNVANMLNIKVEDEYKN